MTFHEIVSDYIYRYRAQARAEMETFRREKNRTSASRRAARCEFPNGKRHPHQPFVAYENGTKLQVYLTPKVSEIEGKFSLDCTTFAGEKLSLPFFVVSS